MNSLAECADVSKPVVYSHFTNKHEIITSLLDDHYEMMKDYVRESTKDCNTIDEYISKLIESSFEFERGNEISVYEISNGHSSDRHVNDSFNRYRDLFKKYWSELLVQQGVPDKESEIIAFAFSGMVNETTTTYSVKPRQQKLARETLKKIIINTINCFAKAPTNTKPDVHVETYYPKS